MTAWLSGKKTIIAATLAVIDSLISEVMIGIWHVDWIWLPNIQSTLAWGMLAFGITGLAHKAIKASNGTTPSEP